MFDDTYTVTGDDLVKAHPDKYILPTSRQIFLDIDSDEQNMLMLERMAELLDFFDGHMEFSCKAYPSKSGIPHRHVIVTFEDDLAIPEKLFLQSFLCSDHLRDIMSFIQYKSGDSKPILLRKVEI